MKEVRPPKLLAIYLPQFYENEDNNRWWGQGFTDWDSVRTAEKYFPEHDEPRIPVNGEYYDLRKRETMFRQAELAKEYGIGGFCFYHYYFKNGKKELELPAENLLKWKDIDMPFCFNWANESWIRSWSRIAGNVWVEKNEKAEKDTLDGILAEQDYGTYEDWVLHFEYLLPFFKDERYIKKDGKPVFLFYFPDDIDVLHEMTACWRKLALKAGLPGLYLIGARMLVPDKYLDAAIVYEPGNSINKLNDVGKAEIKNGVRCFRYGDVCETVLDTESFFDFKTYFCSVTGYDDTPRKGRNGKSLIECSPLLFQQQLTALIHKSMKYQNEFLFINAWNEWGEGMYLEPDVTAGYGYLEAVRNALRMAPTEVEIADILDSTESIKKEMKALDYSARKYKKMFDIMDKWLFLEQMDKALFKIFLQKEGIQSVAIYGMAALGKHLLQQFRKEKIPVAFGIDRHIGQFGSDYMIYRPEDVFPEVDAIIITAYDTVAITEMLYRKYNGRIYSLEEILDSMVKG